MAHLFSSHCQFNIANVNISYLALPLHPFQNDRSKKQKNIYLWIARRMTETWCRSVSFCQTLVQFDRCNDLQPDICSLCSPGVGVREVNRCILEIFNKCINYDYITYRWLKTFYLICTFCFTYIVSISFYICLYTSLYLSIYFSISVYILLYIILSIYFSISVYILLYTSLYLASQKRDSNTNIFQRSCPHKDRKNRSSYSIE